MIRLHLLIALSEEQLEDQLRGYSVSGWQRLDNKTYHLATVEFKVFAWIIVNLRQP